ncbi:ABC transporter permease [Micromonospora costi]|uniref:ABC transporter permease n=2 Tax=Micromonospora costi TaxID=1530042 RepID=A0A3A9ZYG1_9ACTN|nr:ABC transporter permease [Micromonospora costi]
MPTPDAVSAQSAGTSRWSGLGQRILGSRIAGPSLALAISVVIFSATTSTFLTASNVSLILQQSVVVGMLALGQTIIVLTAGIDLANGAIAVLGTVVMGKLAMTGHHDTTALLLGFAVCLALGTLSGGVVTRLNLPPFIVTLGMLTIVTAVARLYTGSQSFPVSSGLLTFLGRTVNLGGFALTYGTLLLLAAFAVVGYMLTQTAWGTHVFAVGNDPNAARLVGIKVKRVLLSAYLLAGLCYGIAAWLALGRIAVADPSGYQSANLDSITAVVIGGTSLFGGRGGVLGTLIGTLIVLVLRNGLTQANIDSLYQDVATGILVIAAVAVDQLARRRQQR